MKITKKMADFALNELASNQMGMIHDCIGRRASISQHYVGVRNEFLQEDYQFRVEVFCVAVCLIARATVDSVRVQLYGIGSTA
jgi:hypothetical protein